MVIFMECGGAWSSQVFRGEDVGSCNLKVDCALLSKHCMVLQGLTKYSSLQKYLGTNVKLLKH